MTRRLLTREEVKQTFGIEAPNYMDIEWLGSGSYNITIHGCMPSHVKKLIKFTMSAKF